ncbi:hypothetical protein JCM8547_000904 [Rhodosporidiobolus lusitaniae]
MSAPQAALDMPASAPVALVDPSPAVEEEQVAPESRIVEQGLAAPTGQQEEDSKMEDEHKDPKEGTDQPQDQQDKDDAPPPPKRARTSLAGNSRTSRRLSGLGAPVSPSGSIRTRATRAGPAPVEVSTSSSVLSPAEAGDEESETRGADGKVYLLSGIYYSEGLPSTSLRRVPPSPSAPTNWRLVTPSSSTLLPPPVYHGATLLEKENEDEDGEEEDGKAFELTYAIMRDFWFEEGGKRRDGDREEKKDGEGNKDAEGEEKREGKGGDKETEEDVAKREASRKPEPYVKIKMNQFVDRKPDKAPIAAVCQCVPPSDPDEMGCGSDCINRMMQYCCEPKLCPCGEQCSNVPLNRREGIPEGKEGLKVIWTGKRGFGLKTMVPIKKGQFVIEYRGEIITRDESYRRVLTTYAGKPSYYFLDYDGFEVIDAGQRGNASRFINHSCGPNLGVVRWRLATVEEYQMGIFALHDIPAGTELTYDYGWQDFSSLASAKAAAAALKASSTSTSDSAAVAGTPTPPPPAAEAAAAATLPTPSPSSASASTSLGDSSSSSSSLPSTSTSTASSSTASPPNSALPSSTFTSASTDATIDPSRQRCYCGSSHCSGFLGSRKKGVSHRKGAGGASSSSGGRTHAKAVTGKRKLVQQQEWGRADWAPPKGGARIVQAKVVLEQEKVSGVVGRVEKRGTAAGVVAKRLAAKKGKGKEKERGEEREKEPVVLEKIVGAMRSGRAAAKKAVGRLLGGGRSALAEAFEEDEEE